MRNLLFLELPVPTAAEARIMPPREAKFKNPNASASAGASGGV
jgi:hypothetical protein